jgi:hypothetical protein
MKLLKVLTQSSKTGINKHLLACCLCLNILLSAASAKSNGKGIGINNPHANPHANLDIKPHSNLHVNPAGIITGTGGKSIRPSTNQIGAPINNEVTNMGAVSGPKGHFKVSAGDTLFLGRSGSNVIVKINPPSVIGSVTPGLKKANMIHPQGGHIRLAAGDIFSKAIANIGSLSSTLEIPDPIGAKGANPGHGGNYHLKGYGNPGGGNGKGNWGKGNKGNGFGNTWTGNQGRGVGAGMAKSSQSDPTEPPNNNEPPVPPEPPIHNDDPYIEPAPLYRETGQTAQEQEFAKGGCPALMNWLAAELGIEEQSLQISVAEAFTSSTDIQACEMAARLMETAGILNDPNGSGVAALASVVNEHVAVGTPISEEQLAQIAAALANHADDDTHYTAADQWLDALVEYISILKDEMGWSAEDAMALVMDKYGTPIKESDNASLMLYVVARLSEV